MKHNRGIAIVTTLLMMVVVVMMVTAGIALLPSNRAMTGSLSDNQGAVAAAEAGIEYARTRLQADPNWKGDGNAVVINEPGKIWVREDRGNVIGILWSSQGAKSLFRMRFNYQNSNDSPHEGFDDPAPEMIVQHPFISYNAVNRPTASPLWRASTDNFEIDDSVTFGDVPKYTAVLYCEGSAGAALSDVGTGNLNPNPNATGLSRRTLEAYIGRDVSQYGDSVVYGATSIDFQVADRILVESSDPNTPPRARTLGNVTMNSTSLTPLAMTNGEVYVGPTTGQFTINGAESTDPEATRADSSSFFLKLGWSQIEKASTGDPEINAGTYVWRDTHPPSLVYYDLDYDPSVGIPATATGTPILSADDLGNNASNSVSMDPNQVLLTIRDNLFVKNSASGVDSLSFITEPGLVTNQIKRANIVLQDDPAQGTSPIVTSPGKFRIEGKLTGTGAVTAEGDVSLQGEALVEAGSGSRVAIYSRGDINLEAIPGAIAASFAAELSASASGSGSGSGGGGGPDYFDGAANPFATTVDGGDVVFSGVVYAQGSFNAPIGLQRNFHLRGVLVAYGGDSEAGENPGSRVNSGRLNIAARNTQFVYDSSYVAGLLDPESPTTLSNLSWRWF